VIRFASEPSRIGALRSRRLLGLASDDALVEQMRRGNEAAFEVAFERYGAGILGFCRHMLGSQEEAEDVVQHTFAAAFHDLGRSSDRALALKPWLYTIARNRCLSVLRGRRQQPAVPHPLSTIGLAEQVERRAEVQELLEDLLELPEDQRAALLLSQGGALSHAEVAEVLGCEPLQVKGLVFRARTALVQRRDARETPCASIREQLANLRGGALRRTELRHHMRACAACRTYGEAVRRQRRLLGAVLPVTPSIALKSSVLGSSATSAGLATAVGGGTAAKVAAACLITAGGAAVVTDVERNAARPAREARVAAPQTAPTAAARLAAPAVVAVQPAAGPVVVRDAADRSTATGHSDARRGRADAGRADHSRRAAGPTTLTSADRPKHAAADRRTTKAAAGPKASKPAVDTTTVHRAEKARGRGPVPKPVSGTPVKRGPSAPKVDPVKVEPVPPVKVKLKVQVKPAPPVEVDTQLPAKPAKPKGE
jgi:RNA polymerase sigma factor (sigma-70 family)